MSSLNDSIKKLESNSDNVYNETVRLLVKIIDNVLKEPANKKLRVLQKNNATIAKKILAVNGGLDCLKAIGFVENGATFLLPDTVVKTHLTYVRDVFVKRKKGDNVNLFSGLFAEEKRTRSEKPIKKVQLPPFQPMFTHAFLNSIERQFHECLVYEDKELQERARQYIPVALLEMKAQQRLRSLQEEVKKKKLQDLEVGLQDMLILELLAWFKESFFTWVDSPDCGKCGNKTKMSHMSNDANLLVYTNRVEMHLCERCNEYTPFPRYNDLNILLETRKGRCGEWANVFTLFCRCMGWDTRYVLDETDHVWTEVYSHTQQRWLHCDPCENACDTPLIYETGWQKQLSYIIAYSAEEVQDVTWRYSAQHSAILRRRTKCTESELIDALIKLREERQKALTEARKKYLLKRLLGELAELMVEKKAGRGDDKGRESGALTWRLARGETHDDAGGCVWLISGDKATLRYSSALDRYEFFVNKENVRTKQNWSAGVFEQKGVFRKEEKDWKMVYVARKEGVSDGFIKWRFVVDANTKKSINKVEVRLNYATYENGEVKAAIEVENIAIVELKVGNTSTSALEGGRVFEIVARLSGGKGDVAWQHAQLFRQSLDASDYDFVVTVTLKD